MLRKGARRPKEETLFRLLEEGTMNAKIVIRKFGGPECLEWEEGDDPEPGDGEILIRHTAIGLNFIDVYHRQGLYPVELPFTPGVEAAGVVEKAGAGVKAFKKGDRAAYFGAASPGAYAELRAVPAARAVKLPSFVDDKTAAALMLKGATAEYLIRRTCPVKKGDVVLFHAAAGGVGLIACQWLAALGAVVIGTAGSPEKAELAKANGCRHVILYREQDVAQAVREITGGRGADVVYDSVGKATFEASLASLKPRGLMVSFGNASGPVPPLAPLELAKRGSLYLTRPTLKDYYSTREQFEAGTAAVLEAVEDGTVKVLIGQTYPLGEVQQAHRDLEARKTIGATVLTVG